MRHIVITGPGRSGTTLLVQLLDRLGFDIGEPQLGYHATARAGMETDILSPNAPHVVKDPGLSERLGWLIESGQVGRREIEWLIVPLRDLDQAAASRVSISMLTRDLRAPGGLVGNRRPATQRQHLAAITYSLFQTAARWEIPLIVLEYPQFAKDADYAYRRLQPMLGERTETAFMEAWNAVVDPGLVRDKPVRVPPLAEMRMAVLRLRRAVKARLTRRRH